MFKDSGSLTWGVVLAAKTLDTSKSRLRGLGQTPAVRLAAAMFEDTLNAMVDSHRVGPVVVVTSDRKLSALARGRGATVIADPGFGLNGAFLAGWDCIGHSTEGIAFIPGDLPCLTGPLVDESFDGVERSTAVVIPDSECVGTTMLINALGPVIMPRFGPGSMHAHREQGARVDLDAPDAMRRDVDTPHDLASAWRIGVGPATTDVCVRLGLTPGRLLPA